MEEAILQEKSRPFLGIKWFGGREIDAEEEMAEGHTTRDPKVLSIRSPYRYNVTVRRGITTFDDAVEAAQGLKNGEQQILNLCSADHSLRQKIVDFIGGVSFALGATWEEVGEHIYVVVPPSGYVEVAASAARMTTNYR